MADGQLILHTGARKVDRAELLTVDAPPPTETWFPLRHDHVLSVVENTLGNAGFSIQRTQLGLSKDNAKFFGTLDLASPLADGVTLTVGVRNSIDKSLPIGLCAGNRVFVCDNLAFSSEIYVSKKHTKFGDERFGEGIAAAMRTLVQYQAAETKRIALFQNSAISDDAALAQICRAFDQGILSSRTLPKAIQEWQEPSHEEFRPRTVWSLFNSFTEALKARQNSPAEFANLTMKVYGLLDQRSAKDVASVVVG